MGSASIGHQFGISALFDGNFKLRSDNSVSSLPCKAVVTRKSIFSAASSTHKVKTCLIVSLISFMPSNTKYQTLNMGLKDSINCCVRWMKSP